MNSVSSHNIFEMVEPNRSIRVSIGSMSKGIDNYHIDVRLSRKFSSNARKLISMLVSQLAVPKPKQWDNSKAFERLRDSYEDLTTVLIHRVNTDMKADEICLLQFAPIKYILKFTRQVLDEEINNTKSKLAELRNKGSSDALGTNQRLFWLKKNYDTLLYTVSKQIFQQLQRVEEKQLQLTRQQYLGPEFDFLPEAITNPLLWVSELSALPLLLNEFSVWSWNGEDEGFINLNGRVEKLFNSRIRGLHIAELKSRDMRDTATEIHDELGGLFELQAFLGKAEDTKTEICEEIDWFENPANLERLFNTENTGKLLSAIRRKYGFKTWWQWRSEVSRLNRTLKAFYKMLRSQKVLPQLLATHYMRRKLHSSITEHVDLRIICQYLSGTITIEKLQESIATGYRLSSEQIKTIEALRESVKEKVERADIKDALPLLLDFSRYRQRLKYFRFAHRAFNRISLLTAEDDIKLSKSAGTLYQLPTSEEIEEEGARIVHHAILKADVRGSTTVTDELQAKGLNPASYFSMRFFNPINNILETYGANKVFIEGDAIILSFLEYEHAPQQWYAVSRACGYAKEMLKITGSNNRYSTQMGLPLLELGVGICYSDDAPSYLYDGDHPIMISGAIGLADRMSGCSWNLRALIKKDLFNVYVLRIADGETDKGEKGQHYMRYNVNGINIDASAFSKLKSEISLRSVRMKLNGKDYLFHVGQYPDNSGRKKDLVIREGKIGLWKDSKIQPDPDHDESYFEVVVNRKVLPVVLDSTSNKQTATIS